MKCPIIILVIDDTRSCGESFISDIAAVLLLIKGVLSAFLVMLINIFKCLLKGLIALTKMNIHLYPPNRVFPPVGLTVHRMPYP